MAPKIHDGDSPFHRSGSYDEDGREASSLNPQHASASRSHDPAAGQVSTVSCSHAQAAGMGPPDDVRGSSYRDGERCRTVGEIGKPHSADLRTSSGMAGIEQTPRSSVPSVHPRSQHLRPPLDGPTDEVRGARGDNFPMGPQPGHCIDPPRRHPLAEATSQDPEPAATRGLGDVLNIKRQPETRPISQEQFQAVIALHEHHHCSLASQYSFTSPALQCLASKCAMPARMWRHSIHSFLELLGYRLPASLDYMLTFIYSAYSMMDLLFEAVPAFAYAWTQCLGDLGRYRKVIEDGGIRDCEVWMGVSRH